MSAIAQLAREGKHSQEDARPWAPLANSVFRALWIASLASHIGTWMQNVGAGWLMTDLNSSPLYVALIQTATSLPVFLIGIPAGAAADLFDRRRLLLFTQASMALAAGLLGWLTLIGKASPIVLLLTTFALGLGNTLNNPAWQAVLPEIVPNRDLPQAISLNSVAFNLARAVGPAIGGFVLAAFNPGSVFILNALSFAGVIVVIYFWKRQPKPQSSTVNESIISATWAGLRYVRYSPGIRAVLVRSGTFIIGGSAIWAILPTFAHSDLHSTATGYGTLLGCLGVGSMIGALLLAKFRLRFSPDQLLIFSGALWGVVTALLGWLDYFPLAAIAMLAGGVAWVTEMSSFNVAAQTVLPAWVRARALAAYLLVFQGGMAISSMLWGFVAEHYGTRAALLIAGLTSLSSLVLAREYPIRLGEERDVTHSTHWPEPVFQTPPDPERGPVLVQIEYDVDPQQHETFAAAMQDLGRIRLRDGAIRWGIFQDAAALNRHVESFLVENWAEHLRQHERITVADREIEELARSFHRSSKPPVTTHLLAAEQPHAPLTGWRYNPGFMKLLSPFVGILGIAACSVTLTFAQQMPPSAPTSDSSYIDQAGAAHVTRVVPVPKTISPEAQKVLTRQVSGVAKPETLSERRTKTDKWQAGAGAKSRELYPANVKEDKIAGVPVRIVTPPTVPAEKQNRVLINVHGGGFNSDSGSLTETIPIANLTQTKVVAVLYRLAPEHPFPADVNDTIAVYKELLKTYKPEHIGLYGTSAGAILTGEVAVKLKQLGVPEPAALGIFSGTGDLSRAGDSQALFALQGLSGPLKPPGPTMDLGFYAGHTDLKDPVLSPLFADLKDMPPALFITSTRDLLLSGTTILHRAFLRAGDDADLVVFEALPHAFWNDPALPESKEADAIMARFFDKHLGK